MEVSDLSREEIQACLKEREEQLRELRRQERAVEERIARMQAALSRSRGHGRQRARVSRSASLPSLQQERRRLEAEIFRLEQETRSLRDRLARGESS